MLPLFPTNDNNQLDDVPFTEEPVISNTVTNNTNVPKPGPCQSIWVIWP